MAFRESSIPRTTYRFGATRRARERRTANAMRPRADGDNSWVIHFPDPSAFRITAAPDPASNVDRDILTLRLLSAEIPQGTEYRSIRGSGGSTDFMRVVSTFRTGDSSGSIFFWFNADNVAGDVLISYDNGASTHRLNIATTVVSGSIYAAIASVLSGTTDHVRGGTAITAGAWHHYAFVSTGTAWAIYLDGVLQTLTTVSGSNTGNWFADLTSATTLRVGENAIQTIFFEGTIAEIGVSSGQLTQANVTYLYNNGVGRQFADVAASIPGLVNYWPCSVNHTGAGNDPKGGLTLTVGSGLDSAGSILAATVGDDRAVKFWAETDGAYLTATTNLRSADTSGSISFWVYPTSAGLEPFITKHDNSASNRLDFYKNSTADLEVRSTLAAGTTNQVRGGTDLTLNAWNHIVVVSSGTAWALYLNGSAQTLTTVAGSNTGDWFGDFTGTLWRFGYIQGSTTNFDGRIDEVGIWSTQLAAGDVTTLYNSGTGVLFDQARLIDGLVHYWSCSQNNGGIGADRIGGVILATSESVTDEVGITAGVDVDIFINQLTLGIRNDEGFIELKDALGNVTWRQDDTGMQWEEGGFWEEEADGAFIMTVGGSDPDFTLKSYNRTVYFYDESAANITFLSSIILDATLGGTITFESGSTIQEQTDGALVITAKGTDPDITLETNTVSAALFLDQAVPEWVFFGELGIDNTLGGRITFASNSYLVEEADGALVMRAVGTDPDITFETNTVSAALFLDQAVPEWVFFGDLGIDGTGGGRITFAAGSTFTETATTGALTLNAVGTDPDLLLESTNKDFLFFDDSATTAMFFSTKVRVDATGAADGGGLTFEPGSVFRVTATTGLTSFRAVGTNPDLQLGSTTYVNAIYWDFSLANLALLAGTDTLQSMTIGAATVATANRGRVDIYQRGTTDALTVLWLNQQDTSEPFIAFEGSATVSNTTESLVAVAAVTTATVIGYAKAYVEDDGNQITDQACYIALYTLT